MVVVHATTVEEDCVQHVSCSSCSQVSHCGWCPQQQACTHAFDNPCEVMHKTCPHSKYLSGHKVVVEAEVVDRDNDGKHFAELLTDDDSESAEADIAPNNPCHHCHIRRKRCQGHQVKQVCDDEHHKCVHKCKSHLSASLSSHVIIESSHPESSHHESSHHESSHHESSHHESSHHESSHHESSHHESSHASSHSSHESSKKASLLETETRKIFVQRLLNRNGQRQTLNP